MPTVLSDAHTGAGRHRRGHRTPQALSEINVVPLVDVMLVLLIIFMIAAPMLQRGVDVRLPVATRSSEISGERIFINIPISFREQRQVYIGEEAIGVELLPERVRQVMLTRTDKEVFLRGDQGIEYQELMEILDALKAGGIENVGLVARLPGEQ